MVGRSREIYTSLFEGVAKHLVEQQGQINELTSKHAEAVASRKKHELTFQKRPLLQRVVGRALNPIPFAPKIVPAELTGSIAEMRGQAKRFYSSMDYTYDELERIAKQGIAGTFDLGPQMRFDEDPKNSGKGLWYPEQRIQIPGTGRHIIVTSIGFDRLLYRDSKTFPATITVPVDQSQPPIMDGHRMDLFFITAFMNDEASRRGVERKWSPRTNDGCLEELTMKKVEEQGQIFRYR